MPRRDFYQPPTQSTPKRTKSAPLTTGKSPSPTGPDFTNECHFTMQIFSCSHKHFLRNPKITHVSPCDLQSAPKSRCKNMASSSKEVYVRNDCPKCKEELALRMPRRTTSLGLGQKGNMVELVQARIKELEQTAAPEAKEEKVEVPKAASSDGSIEIINVDDAPTPAEIQLSAQAQASSKSPEPKQSLSPQSQKPTSEAAQEPNEKSIKDLEHKFKTDPEFRDQEKAFWLSLPSADNGSKASILSKFSRIFRSSTPKAKETEEEAQIRKDWAYVTDQGNVEAEVEAQDDDWVHVDDSEAGKK